MKRFITISFIIIFFFPSLCRVWIIADFKINQDFIAKVLCVNKNKPDNNCNGKCHLNKQLQKVEKNERKQLPNNNKEDTFFNLFLIENSVYIKNIAENNKNFNVKKSLLFLLSGYISEVFHPPKS